jgi:hypothetical protein
MAMEPVTHALDDLLRHERFVQRLAKSLLSTTGEADDLVQETWLRAVQHPPEERGLAVGWLRKVMRNLARDWRVGASRRQRREIAAARTDVTPPLQQIIERRELQRQIVEPRRVERRERLEQIDEVAGQGNDSLPLSFVALTTRHPKTALGSPRDSDSIGRETIGPHESGSCVEWHVGGLRPA